MSIISITFLSSFLTSLFKDENDPVKSNAVNNTNNNNREISEMNTTFHYNIILKEYLEKGSITFVFRLYQEMISKGIEPDQLSYNLLLSAFQQSGQPSRCLKYLREMEEKGLANSTSYSIVIKSFYATQDPEKAHEIYKEMIQKNKLPNAVILNELLHAQSVSSDWTSALKIMDEFTKFNLIPTVDTYSNLLLCLCHSDNAKLVLDWWKKADEDLKSRSGSKYDLPLMVIGTLTTSNFV